MLRNYFRIAFRNLVKRKGYSFLNIIGLAIGMACCLLIFQYVAYERGYDEFPSRASDIVRLRLDSYQQGKLSWKSATVYPAFGPTMKKDFPEIEDFCRLYDANILLSNEEKHIKFSEQHGYFADPSFLPMFDVQMKEGDYKTALDGPDKIVLSESSAKKYFGTENPVGKLLTHRHPDYTRTYMVSGVFRDFPSHSHLKVDHLVSYATLRAITTNYGDTSNAAETNFGWYDFYTYLQLKPGTSASQLEAKFPAYCKKYMDDGGWFKANNVHHEIHLIGLGDIHLYSNYNQEAEANGNGQSVSFLFIIAFFILGIAWVNYINLATARSLERAREVGVRKVMGAARSGLIIQFLVESVLLNLIALMIAFGITWLLTPYFNQLTGREGSAGFYLPLNYWMGFAAMFITGSLMAGIYPAFVLSAFRPVAVLKGLFKNTSKGVMLRKGLIVAQFATSVVLIAGTIIVYQQVNYMRRQQLGADINQTLVLKGALSQMDSSYQASYLPFKQELLKIPGIKSVAASSDVMGREVYWTNGAWKMGDNNKGAVTLFNVGIDEDFIPSYNLKLLAGRNFSKELRGVQRPVLLNEKGARAMGFDDFEKSINEKFVSGGDTVTIIGIVANFHQEGLQKEINPMIFRPAQNARNFYSLKMESASIGNTIAAIEKTWSNYFPADPFDYFFLDQSFDSQYRTDKVFGKVFGGFAFLAIIIACFGLLGLSAYNVLQRTKEIGIRKVLGASVNHLLYILSKDFIVLVAFSFLIAAPVTWWIMHQWLEGFAYRVSVSFWVLIVSGVLAIIIALLTIVAQALKASLANPVKSLRNE